MNVGSSIDNRNRSCHQRLKKLFSDVVFSHTVFKGEVKLAMLKKQGMLCWENHFLPREIEGERGEGICVNTQPINEHAL